MKVNWQIVSILSRFVAVFIGLVQSIIIVKLLSVEEYGLIKIATSIIAVVGIYQNLGISSGSTREISASKDRKEVFKVFIGSLLVRYIISLPLVLGLFFFADNLGKHYNSDRIITPIRILGLILFIQAFQSVLNSVILGLKQFKFIFIFQAVIAVVSLFIFGTFIYLNGYNGFFIASLLFTIISTIVLLIFTYKLIRGNIEWPKPKELYEIFKTVFSIGFYVYIIKIIFTQWQSLGPLVLGPIISSKQVGILAFALLAASKVSTISDAVTDVTLPSMTEVFEKSRDKFKETFVNSNTKAFFLILFCSVLLIILKAELFKFVDIIFSFMHKAPISEKYSESFTIMDPLIIAFWGYSHLNLLKSGLAIPAKTLKDVLIASIAMICVTLGIFYLIKSEPLFLFSISMCTGALFGYLLLIILIKRRLKFFPLCQKDVIYTLVSIVFLVLYYLRVNVYSLSFFYILVSLFVYNDYSVKKILSIFKIKN